MVRTDPRAEGPKTSRFFTETRYLLECDPLLLVHKPKSQALLKLVARPISLGEPGEGPEAKPGPDAPYQADSQFEA